MKKILIFLMFSILSVWLLAQTGENPFTKLGYKKDITYTMSKGQFDEAHDQMEIVEIGNVFYNTRTNKIIGYVGNEKENDF